MSESQQAQATANVLADERGAMNVLVVVTGDTEIDLISAVTSIAERLHCTFAECERVCEYLRNRYHDKREALDKQIPFLQGLHSQPGMTSGPGNFPQQQYPATSGGMSTLASIQQGLSQVHYGPPPQTYDQIRNTQGSGLNGMGSALQNDSAYKWLGQQNATAQAPPHPAAPTPEYVELVKSLQEAQRRHHEENYPSDPPPDGKLPSCC